MAVHAVERHDDDAAREDRGHVGDEEEQRTERLIGRAGFERESDHRERRHERDRDRDAGQRVGDVGAARATAPTAPVASAATRSMRRGETRDATCELVAATTVVRHNLPSNQPIAITAIAPVTTSSSERARFARSASTTASTIPRIGVMSGATIIAPMTVAGGVADDTRGPRSSPKDQQQPELA